MNLENLDIVYMVKDAVYNDELKYSLRSVDKNFPHKRVVFIGGKPMHSHPDLQLIVNQKGKTKWDRVRAMLKMIAENDELSENIVLFNDDFFVLNPVENLPTYRYGTLEQLCGRIERKNNGAPTPYTLNLANTIATLRSYSLPTLNYELHIPMIINRAKLYEIIELFPNTRGTRSLYGNKYLSERDTVPMKDVKIIDNKSLPKEHQAFVSTEDLSFERGAIGKYIRAMFPDKSRFEH